MICIPLSAATNDDMLALIARAEQEPADLYEYRFDSMAERPDVERLIAAASKPVIATCRAVDEGGGFRGGKAERLAILRRAGAAGAIYIDAEEDDIPGLIDCGTAIRIVSMHDFTGTPADLTARVAALAATEADWVKFAVAAQRHADNLAVFSALANCPKPAIAIAMGPKGIVTRILGGRFGSRITFGSLDSGLESAPGQTTAGDLVDIYRVNSITETTELHAFLGAPDTPALVHTAPNQAFAKAGRDAVSIPFLTDDADDFLRTLPRALGFQTITAAARHAAAALAWAGVAAANAAQADNAIRLVKANDHWQVA